MGGGACRGCWTQPEFLHSGSLELQSPGSQGAAGGETLLEVGRVLTLPRETRLKEPVVQVKMSFRSLRLVLALLSAYSCCTEQPKWPFVSRTNTQEIGKSLF